MITISDKFREKGKREIIKVVIPAGLHLISIFPFTFSLVFLSGLDNRPLYFCILISTLVSIPTIFAISVGLLGYTIPKIPEGKYPNDSKEFSYWLLRTLIFENILNSSYINNLVNRTWIIRFIVYKLAGMETLSEYIISPDVKLLDPDKIYIGKGTFIGTCTTISSHLIIKYRNTVKIVLSNVCLGEDCIIGAQCSIGPGTTIGDKSNIDLHVIVNNNVSIGKSTTVSAGTRIDSNVSIGNNVRIGKCCVIGSRVKIDDGARLGNSAFIGSGVHIRSNEVVEEMGKVSTNHRKFVRQNSPDTISSVDA